MGKYDRESVIRQLQNKQTELREQGTDRYPRRSDFSDDEVVAIKAFLGPWPRALEAAGLKPCRDGARLEKNRQKRSKAKRNRREALKAAHTDKADEKKMR